MGGKKKETEETEMIEKKTGPCMYVGPTVPALGLVQNVVYTDIPDTAKSRMEEIRLLGALFVEIKAYPEAEKELRERRGYIWQAFRELAEYRNKNGGR